MKGNMKGNMENKQVELMSRAPVRKAILKLSIPVICGMMVQVFYNLVDTFFIGRLNDSNQLAAVSITTPIFMILMSISTIVATGAASFISRSIGNQDQETANKTLSTGYAICTGLGLIVMTLGLIFLEPLILVLGASSQVFPYALSYARIMFLGAISVMLNFCGGQLLRAEGAVMPSMMGMLIGTVVNIALDPLFIFAFHMGVAGAALATVLGNTCAMLYYVYLYVKGRSLLRFQRRLICGPGRIWGQIFSIGIPAALSQLLTSVAMIVLNNMAKGYGDDLLAGMGISAKLMYIGTFIFMGFAAGCQPLIGYNYGAKNFERVRDVFKNGMIITAAVGFVLTGLFSLFAETLIGFFTPLPQVVAQGAIVLRISIVGFVVVGPQMLATTGIQAFGKALQALILSVTRQGVFYIPLMLLMNRLFQLKGLIWAQPLSEAATLILGLFFLTGTLKKCMISEKGKPAEV